jgi:hypothetical protein
MYLCLKKHGTWGESWAASTCINSSSTADEFFLHLFSSVISLSVVAALISVELAQSKERWSLRRTKIEEIYLRRGDDLTI